MTIISYCLTLNKTEPKIVARTRITRNFVTILKTHYILYCLIYCYFKTELVLSLKYTGFILYSCLKLLSMISQYVFPRGLSTRNTCNVA